MEQSFSSGARDPRITRIQADEKKDDDEEELRRRVFLTPRIPSLIRHAFLPQTGPGRRRGGPRDGRQAVPPLGGQRQRRDGGKDPARFFFSV